jgi:hypothetical protein
MFEVGDIVKYRSEVISDVSQWIGIVIQRGHNGYNEWLKVKYFKDGSERTAASARFIKA